MFLIDNLTKATFFRSVKKKAAVFTIFCDFVILLEKHYNIEILTIYTDFGEFNFNTEVEYFSYIDSLRVINIKCATREQWNKT